ncbi:polysaccharide deacetylase family protein [Mobilitalea sibirica]|uniref:Polysaccharide deacetylase family protein n=1 Tax=Mobilitalea sibirica TaxID=1462919 RepID=A0A8J7KW16_9FIRM|nr:polysaccharide deacetylase family protein [Mobilitalea sibirica]MBH1940825.1 polysaccharide deacetylase family protein [Mobilitalea sibirica]
MSIEFLYQNGTTKALTFSYDDGQIYDRRLVEIFNKFKVKGTFHINSGKVGDSNFIGKDEVKTLFQGHEVACHGVEHKYLTHLPKEMMIKEIWDDRRSLESMTGQIITGMSYAFGEYGDEIVNTLSCLGFKYSRTVNATNNFTIPSDFMRWNPTCHHNDNIMEKAKRFLNMPGYMKLPLFYIWGHSFEFERENNWEVIEQFCEEISFKEDIWYTTNIDYRNYVTAMRELVFNVDHTCVYNPTGCTIWIKSQNAVKEILPGATVSL